MNWKPHPGELVDALSASSPEALRLAKQLSLAVSIEPALLRQARIEAYPVMDVSAESALWFSPIVESRSFNGIIFRPDVAAALRKTLAQEAAQVAGIGKSNPLKSARRLTRRAHRAAPATIRLHEELIWLELTATSSDIDQLLGEIFFHMIADATEGAAFACWFSSVASELPDEARRISSFQTLDTLSARMLRRKRRFDQHAYPTGALWNVPPHLLNNLPITTVWAALTSDALIVQALQADGFRRIELPKTNLLVVEIEIDGRGIQTYFWDPREPLWVPFVGSDITIQTWTSRIRFTRRRNEAPSTETDRPPSIQPPAGEGPSTGGDRFTFSTGRYANPFGELKRIPAKISIDLEIHVLNRPAAKSDPVLGSLFQREFSSLVPRAEGSPLPFNLMKSLSP